ncbi:Protein kinase-like domain protein [Niveomyces insectorum RCEF 264]|uniref:Protein kinase-like domain protein n=1 Tax=Niveomyces insectorum RCEF 264 TaxID=1081102 RepID=A0A167WBH1_9HYPO|nr:Protein kinase-like domain protein [Niveomyces insectorum RCEF 264]
MNGKPKIFSNAQFNVGRLLALAERLHGQPCRCDQGQRPFAGSMNWAIVLTFDNGIQWIFRSPLPGVFSDDFVAKIITSEVVTTRCILARSSVPVPEIYAFSASRDNEIGVPYILQSKATGHCLLDYSIREAQGLPGLSDRQRAKVMQQLGVFTQQLECIRFPQIGSLVLKHDVDGHDGRANANANNNDNDNGECIVGPCLSPALTWHMRHLLDDLDRGPFASEKDYFDALAVALARHAQELPMTHHVLLAPIPQPVEYPSREQYQKAVGRWNSFVVVGNKIEHSRNRFAYCVAADVLRQTVVPRLLCRDETRDTVDTVDTVNGMDGCNAGFPLMHPDLHVGNIFVDDAMNITCIIDWSSATTVPAAELFATPRLWEHKEPEVRPAFRQSAGAALAPAFGSSRAFWARSDKIRVFQRLVRFSSSRDYDYLAELVSDDVTDCDGLLDLLEQHAQEPQNKALLTELQEDDASSGEVAEYERASSNAADWRAETNVMAVARKLTVMWHMNPRFVADRRLWRWLGAALDSD